MLETKNLKESTISRSGRLVAYIVLLAVICLVGLYLTFQAAQGYAAFFGGYHDDGIYTVCAKALSEGDGYRIISLPTAPLQTKYPMVFPLILSNAWWLNPHFPSNIVLLELTACSAGIWFVLAAGAFLVHTRRATPLMALAVVAASWTNLEFVSFMPATMADVPATAFCILCVWLCETMLSSKAQQLANKRPARHNPYPWIALGILMMLCSSTHAMAVFAIAAVMLYILLCKNYRGLAISAATYFAFAVPSALWIYLNAAKSPQVMVYYTNYLKAATSAAAFGGGTFQYVGANLSTSLAQITDLTVQIFKSIFPAAQEPQAGVVLAYSAVWLLIVLGLIVELLRRKQARLLAVWIVVYIAAHLLWPHGVFLRRMLVILPFLYYYLFCGVRLLGKWLRKPVTTGRTGYRMVSLAAAGLGLATILAGNLKEDKEWMGHYGYRIPPPTNAPSGYSEASEFQATYKWINDNTAKSDVIVWNNDPDVYLFTGRKAILACLGESWGVSGRWKYINSADILESIEFAHGNYLIIDPISSGGLPAFDQMGKAVKQIMREHPGALTPEFTTRYGLITIFKIHSDKIS